MAFEINGIQISDEVIEEEFDALKEHYERLGEAVCCDRDQELHAYAKENVVNRTLLEQESIRRFGEIDPALVTARFEALKEEHGGEDAFFANTGFHPDNEAKILEKLRSSLIIDRLIDAELDLPETPSEEELEQYYRENIDQFMGEEEVRVSQIFVEPTSHEAATEAYLALRSVRRELLAGKDFDTAAREHSSDSDRKIDLGFLKQGQTMPEVEAITFSMEIGEISPIVATHYGFHLFKLTDRKDPAPIPREEIPSFSERYLNHRRTQGVESFIASLKAASTIIETPEESDLVEA